MVDIATYRTMHSDDSLQRDDLGGHLMDLGDPPEDPFVLLLPANIRGYGFHDKKWSKFLPQGLNFILIYHSENLSDRKSVV